LKVERSVEPKGQTMAEMWDIRMAQPLVENLVLMLAENWVALWKA
jgi:hypothetical protein